MRQQHDTKMLEQVIRSVSERLEAPAREVREASARKTQHAQAQADATRRAAEASARREEVGAEGKRVFVVLVALSLLVLAAGLAGRLIISAMPEPVEVAAPIPAPPPETVRPPWPNVPAPSESTVNDQGVVTTNFTLFREKTVRVRDKALEVTAGHEFKSETDADFSHAWCYTNVPADGVVAKLSLGTKLPGQPPVHSAITPSETKKTGLTGLDARTLFAACPWLDGNPNLTPPAPDPKAFLFQGDVTTDAIDRLVAALSAGAGTVHLNSPGGDLYEGLRGHSAIVKAGAETVAVGECASACTLLFLGGRERRVGPEGVIGVHQWATEGGLSPDSDAQLTSAMLVQLIANAGVSEEFYIAGASTPAQSMYWLSPRELTDWSVITGPFGS